MKYLVSKRKQGGRKKYEQFFATEEGNGGCLDHSGLSDLTVGLNVFIIPMNLYSWGSSRSCTAVKLWAQDRSGLRKLQGLNLYGIIYLLLNIPILFIAWFKIGKTFYKYNPWNGRNQFIYFNRTNSGNSSDR